MHKYISKYSRLLVISDTGIVKLNEGYKAYEPVVKELNSLLNEFNEITWIGFHKKDQINNNSYIHLNNNKINILALKSVGGRSFLSKIKIFLYYPYMFFIIFKEIKKHTYIHTRAPSHPSFIAVLISFFYPQKVFWHKFAGNWNGYLSWFYKAQKKLLKHVKNESYVTVNGNWSNQKKHIIPFENPCLTKEDRKNGKEIIQQKTFGDKIHFCFVGNINYHKGVHLIVEAFTKYKNDRIGEIHFVGSSDQIDIFKDMSNSIPYDVFFHGFLNQDELKKIYEKCHFLLLPSKSEGFPKVVGEAMNYGCIPIVSKVSCIDQYIKEAESGFLLFPITEKELNEKLDLALSLESKLFMKMISFNYSLAEKFTYKAYIQNLKEKIFII